MSSNSIDDAALTKCRIADIYAFPPMRSLHDANDCDGTDDDIHERLTCIHLHFLCTQFRSRIEGWIEPIL